MEGIMIGTQDIAEKFIDWLDKNVYPCHSTFHILQFYLCCRITKDFLFLKLKIDFGDPQEKAVILLSDFFHQPIYEAQVNYHLGQLC